MGLLAERRERWRIMEVTRENFTISDDASRLDRGVIHRFLADSYWANAIPREIVDRSIGNSMCFGVYDVDAQVGFARVITDRATFAYIADVFVLESHRGRGLSKWLMEVIRTHPDLQGLRRWLLMTRDAHGLYRQFGFDAMAEPWRCMEIVDREIYKRAAATSLPSPPPLPRREREDR
jgi:GNAT superfamily N-acetyltransferase